MPFRGALPKLPKLREKQVTIEEILRSQNRGSDPPRNAFFDGRKERRKRSSSQLYKNKLAAKNDEAEPETGPKKVSESAVGIKRNSSKPMILEGIPSGINFIPLELDFNHTSQAEGRKQGKQGPPGSSPKAKTKPEPAKKPSNQNVNLLPSPKTQNSPAPIAVQNLVLKNTAAHNRMSQPVHTEENTGVVPQKRMSKSNVGQGINENVEAKNKPARKKSKSDIPDAGGTAPAKRKSKSNVNDALGTIPAKRKSKTSVPNIGFGGTAPAKRKSKSNVNDALGTIPAKRKSKTSLPDIGAGGTAPAKRKSKSNVNEAAGTIPAKRKSKTNVNNTTGTTPAKRQSKSNVNGAAAVTVPAKRQSKSNVNGPAAVTVPAKRQSKSNVNEAAAGTAPAKRKSKSNVIEPGGTAPAKRKSKSNVAAAGGQVPAQRNTKPDASPQTKKSIGAPGGNDKAKIPTRHMKSTDVGAKGTVAAERLSRTNLLPPPKRKSKSDVVGTFPKQTPVAGGVPGKKTSKVDVTGKTGNVAGNAQAPTGKRKSKTIVSNTAGRGSKVDLVFGKNPQQKGTEPKRDSNNSNASRKRSGENMLRQIPEFLTERKSKSDVKKASNDSNPFRKISATKVPKRTSKTNVTPGTGVNKFPPQRKSEEDKNKLSQDSGRKSSKTGLNPPKRGSKAKIPALVVNSKKQGPTNNAKKRSIIKIQGPGGVGKNVGKKSNNVGRKSSINRKVSFSRKVSVTKIQK